uniref:Uncharacterized protein n=1 Tax=Acrobeloides nanus TaxID=290746 RepID=A0A914D6Q5_9BILA
MARREYNGKINLEDFIVFEELSPGGPGIHGNAYQSSFSTDMKPTDETFFQAIPKPEDKEELQHKSKQKPEIKEKPKGLNKFVIDFFGDYQSFVLIDEMESDEPRPSRTMEPIQYDFMDYETRLDEETV